MTDSPDQAGTIRVGTSGWSYAHWKDRFYRGVPQKRWLAHYQERFPSVEINATFYRLPKASTVDGWREHAPPGFCFAVKGSRFITHIRRLRDCEAPVARFFSRVEGLGPALGPVLWQLPPDLERDDERLRAFVAVLPREHRHAVEFRHRSWYDEAVAEILDRAGVAMVSVSSTAMPATRWLTGGMAYARFHGLEGGFAHDYTDAELAPWVRWARKAARAGANAFAFFNNDGMGRAPENAAWFQERIRRR